MNPLILKRVGISMLIGMVLAAISSELSFVLLKETIRPPKEVVLTIPAGTAEQVARGEQPPTIPTDMVFVVGDTLTVKNEDVVDHKLGQLWIPAHSSASMKLNESKNTAFECSFEPSNYFGLNVQEALTLGTRIYGAFYMGFPLGMLFFVYSFVIAPKKRQNVPA